MLDLIHPVAATTIEAPRGFVDPRHRHHHGQLLFLSNGLMQVETDDAVFAMTPRHAVWLPPGEHHAGTCRSDVVVRAVWVSPEAASVQSPQSRLIETSDLLRALIGEVAMLDAAAPLDPRAERLGSFLLDELRLAADSQLLRPCLPQPHLQMPRDARLRRLCRHLQSRLDQPLRLDEAARVAGMSRRNMTRLFRAQLGCSVGIWLQQARLAAACARLAEGHSVGQAALAVGYQNPGTLGILFQRTLGTGPGAYARAVQRRLAA